MARRYCKELVEIFRNFRHFRKLPIHGKIQQLRISRTRDKFEWNDSRSVKVVTIQSAHHLRKIIVKALRKIFNSTKPKDVENTSNGTNAKMVPWYSNCNSPDPTKIELGIAMTAKGKHKQWLEKLIHISLGIVEELQMPILSEVDGEIILYQILMSLRSKVYYNCTIFQTINKHAVSGNIEATQDMKRKQTKLLHT